MTNPERNIEILKSLYAAYGRGDLATLLAGFSTDHFESFGIVADARARAPWHLQLTDGRDVHKYFAALAGALDPVRVEPSLFAGTGDWVYVTLDMTYKVKSNGKLLEMRDVVHKFKFRDGKIVAWRGSEDTAHTLEVLG